MKRRQPPQPYPQLVATDEILSLTKHHIETLRKARNDIVRDVTPQNATFENVVRPLINAQHTIEDSSGMITVLRYASPDTATRKAAEVARDLWNEAFSEFSDRQDIYILIQAVKYRAEPLDPESTRYPEELLADFVRCGHGVPTREGISEYVKRRAAIDELRGEFTKNDPLRLRAAGKTQVDNNITDSGTCFVSLNKHDINTVVHCAKSADIRRRAYIANSSKLPVNLPIFKEVISLRDKSARQLGYTRHAAYRLEKRLAKNTDWVYHFMDDLEETLLPQGAKEIAELMALRATHTSQAKHENGNAHALSAWDYPYFKCLSLEAVSVDQDKIAEYFPIESTILQALGIMLENWCWLPEELKQLSCHYTTLCPGLLQEWQLQHPNEPTPPMSIPDSLVDPLIQHRHAFRALCMLGQLADARLDMAVHDPPSQAACAVLDPTTLYTSLHEQLTFESTSPGERGHPHADFTHLLSGYDAGCCSYLSAQVFAADLFAEFKDDPRTQETWERYRTTVLERGASMDELQNLCDFLGRPPDAKALLLSS
ncbi:hypothetical protein E4T38_03304 [Aureobasidium subglaciale]|nr:hypothetical protein E4T38_03304 [Aureobasidium subglaciale]KAI5226487.1 hypothetical protein E4T40_03078 [Aureobasidium subglaciale]KAI5229875.1 hypothetical protein E4T41_03301 [Aureobasidium subglaciale]KAI5264323.1 hypothetical protein E4T46_03079 [Aureobasidium subglaciale]